MPTPPISQTTSPRSPRSSPTPLPDLLRQAIALATDNVTSGRGGPFGALIARGPEIIATGVNLVTSTNDPTAHAEVVAIRRAAAERNTFSLTGCQLYASCEPCPMCLAASLWARLDAVFFAASTTDATHAGFDDSTFYSEISLPHHQRSIPTLHIPAPSSGEPFAAWHRNSSRIHY